jgi:hypothetical protein
MYFVLKQHRELGRTFDVNVRIGGFRTIKGALNACKKHAPALVKDETRRIVAQSISPSPIHFIL